MCGLAGRGSARPTVWSFALASWVMTTTFQQLDSDGLVTRIRDMSTNLLMARIQRRPSSRCCRAIIARPHLDRCRHHNASVARRRSLRLHFGYIGLLSAWLLFMKKRKRKISKTDRVFTRKNGRIPLCGHFVFGLLRSRGC